MNKVEMQQYNPYTLQGAQSIVKKGNAEIIIAPQAYIKNGLRNMCLIVEKGKLNEDDIKRLTAVAITQNNLYKLNESTTPYYIVSADDKNAEESMEQMVRSISRLQFNQIILESRYTVLWTTVKDKNNIYYSYNLGELKLQAGASSHLGNGFYFMAGYYNNGNAIVNGDYAIVSVNKNNAGNVKIIGNVNQIKNYLSSALKNDATAATSNNYILTKLNKDKNTGYNYTLCIGRLSNGVTLTKIQTWINTNDSTSGNSTDINGGSINSGLSLGGNYSSAYNAMST